MGRGISTNATKKAVYKEYQKLINDMKLKKSTCFDELWYKHEHIIEAKDKMPDTTLAKLMFKIACDMYKPPHINYEVSY